MNDRLVPGSSIDGLTVKRRIGSGGSGIAYLVHNNRIGRDECLKILPRENGSVEFLKWEEARHASSTGIPGVVTVFTAGQFENTPWFTMEYAPHGDLRGALSRLLPINSQPQQRLELIIALLEDVAVALDQLHSLDTAVVHGDVKPQNILVFDGHHGRYQAKLADFGLAAIHDASFPDASSSTPVSGTLPYLAPERFYGTAPSPATDRYAFACTAFELITGHQAFSPDDSSKELDATAKISLYRELHTNPQRPAPSSNNPALSKADPVFAAALSIDPSARPATATEFHRRLATSLRLPTRHSRKTPIRKTLVLTGVTLVTLLILFGVTFALYRNVSTHSDTQVSQPAPPETPQIKDDQPLPIDMGCPTKAYFGLDNSLSNTSELREEYATQIAPNLPEKCIIIPELNSISGSLSPNKTDNKYPTVVLFVFNSEDSQTQEMRNFALEKTVTGPDMTKEATQIIGSKTTAEMMATYRIEVLDLNPDEPAQKSSTCALSSDEETLTVLQINYGLDLKGSYQVGDGKTAKSQACGAASELVSTWMTDTS